MATNNPPALNTLADMDIILAQLKDIAALVTRAAQAETLEQVLERIAQVSLELVQARYAALGVPDQQGGLKYFKVAGISPESARQIGHLPQGRGLLGVLMEERQPIRLARMQDDARAAGFCEGHPEMTSLLGVPIQIDDQLLGLLYLCDRKDGEPFSEQDQWVVEVMASYAAMAIVNSRLREQRTRLAMLEERERISMELHDGVIQSLYAIGMQVELLSGSTANSLAAEMRNLIQSLNRVIEDIRSYIQDLKAETYGQKPVAECLQDMLNQVHIPEKLKVSLEAPSMRAPFPPTTFEAICQIAHEAVSNVVRHADATNLSIRVSSDEDLFRIVITDDGRGFDVASVRPRSGLGLRNIQQRARLHGGYVEIKSAPGEGTRLTITIPIRMV